MKEIPNMLTISHRDRDDLDDVYERPLDFRLIRRLFGYTRRQAWRRNFLLLVVVIRSVQLPMVAWALGAVINGPIMRGDMHGTMMGALGFGALAAFTQLTMRYRQGLALQLGEQVVHDLRKDIFSHLMKMPMGFYNRMKLGRIISRMTSDVDSVRQGVQDVTFVTLVALGQILVSAVFMFFLDKVLFSVVVLMGPVVWTLNRAFRKRMSRATRATHESFSRVTATLAESVNGIRVTQGFVRQSVNADMFRNLVLDHSTYNLQMSRIAGVFVPLLEFSSQFFTAVLILVGGYRVLGANSHMPVGDLVQFLFLAGVFFAPIPNLGNMYNHAMSAMAGAERVFRLLDMKPEWEDDPDASDVPGIRGMLQVDHLTFGYFPDRTVLHDVDFRAEPGQTVALVGHTGSGKTSLVNLIAKFYLPVKGRVLIDGIDLRKIRGESLHRQMGIIQQQNFIFSGSVMDNIRVGKPSATDREIVEAARSLDCLDLLESLPDGLNTVVGERGTGLSLGQRQLVCFVRAMIADPRILILDEATSSVDTMTEARIQQSLGRLVKGRTCIVIAHRLSTIRNADMVLVMNNGKIVERGGHLELLSQGGIYTDLYRQFVRASEAADDDPED